uniref:Intraflagellar transport protein 20 n=1 Tax=Nyctotherus ovalis TaxID=70075 RepID=A6MI40_NYCOV|nr:hypothetical protein [Nyctotherus ovalis]
MSQNAAVAITFDDNNQIRVLEADKYKETENLKNESLSFLKKIVNFNETVEGVIDVLNTQAHRIENEKLKSVGVRNKIEGESESRKRKAQELQSLINEKKMELERLQTEYELLLKVTAGQKLLIDKLTNNES